ncbi:MAG: hypothetical protein WAN75_06375, partial [Xanthobacteraceae bacterium]
MPRKAFLQTKVGTRRPDPTARGGKWSSKGDGAVVGELVGVAQQIQQRLPQAHLIGMQRPDCIVTIDPVRPRETKTARLTRELSEALKQQAATAVVGFLAAVRARQAGHAAAAPPRSVMNSRRLVRRHRIED